jgi:hypothetical protein
LIKKLNQESRALRARTAWENTLCRLIQNLTHLRCYKKLFKLFNRFLYHTVAPAYHPPDSLSSIFYKSFILAVTQAGRPFLLDKGGPAGYNGSIPPRRTTDMKKKRLFLIPLCLLLLAAAWFLLRSRIPQRWYTADELGIPQLQSPLDADGDGVDDWTDMVLGARAYIATHPHYNTTPAAIPATAWGCAPT